MNPYILKLSADYIILKYKKKKKTKKKPTQNIQFVIRNKITQ